MNTTIFHFPLWIAAILLMITGCDKESMIEEHSLPAAAQRYIQTHFEGITVDQVIKDVDGFEKSFEVYLRNGAELEFNRKGSIHSVKGTEKLPDSVVPSKVLDYVKTHYADQYVLAWELDDNQQEVKLSGGRELLFRKNGDFIRID